MELIDKQALREKLKDKICIFPAAIRRAIDEAPVVYEVEVSNRANLQDHIMSLIPDTIDTDAGTHVYLLPQERLEIAKAVTNGLIYKFKEDAHSTTEKRWIEVFHEVIAARYSMRNRNFVKYECPECGNLQDTTTFCCKECRARLGRPIVAERKVVEV